MSPFFDVSCHSSSGIADRTRSTVAPAQLLMVLVMLASTFVPSSSMARHYTAPRDGRAGQAADCASPAIPSEITADTTLGGARALTTNVNVGNGATLVLEPGTAVAVCGAYTLNIGSADSPSATGGGLQAIGTAVSPITFTPAEGVTSWVGIVLRQALRPTTLRHLSITGAGGAGVNCCSGALSIYQSTTGIGPTLDNVTITNSMNTGLYIDTPESSRFPPQMSNLTISNSAGPALRVNAATLAGLGAGNNFSGNSPNTIQVKGAGTGGVRHSMTWRRQPVPLEILDSISVFGAANPVLTIEAGTSFLMRPPSAKLAIGATLGTGTGGLVAKGTASDPITFGSASAGEKWDGITFGSSALPSTLRYVSITDGGGERVTNFSGALTINQAADRPGPIVDHVTIANSGNNAIFVEVPNNNPDPPFFGNLTITGNAGAAMYFTAPALGGLGTGNTFTGNTPNTIHVRGGGRGGIRYSQTWRRQPVPIELMQDIVVSGPQEPLLTIEPGTTLRMHGSLRIGSASGPDSGGLVAIGTPQEPISIAGDGVNAWGGLVFNRHVSAQSRLSYVDLEGGGGASTSDIASTIEVSGGNLRFDHLTVSQGRNNGILVQAGAMLTLEDSMLAGNRDGVRFTGGARGILRRNQIVSNARFSVANTSTRVCVDAIGNFWGSGAGPTDNDATPDACGMATSNSGGGAVLTSGVAYSPWLRAANPNQGIEDRSTIKADRLWANVENAETATLEITLRDAQGVPLVGKQVQLTATRGTITQPATLTDSQGRTTATIRSSEVGVALITARNVTDNRPLAVLATMLFWQNPSTGGGLVLLSGAPYETPQLLIGGKPYQRGWPITFRFPMRNSNPVPVGVRVVYSVSGLNIGAAFTPVFTATRTLSPGESWDAAGGWVPDVTGHHCIRVQIETAEVRQGAAVAQENLGPYVVIVAQQVNADIASGGQGGFEAVDPDRLDDALPDVSDITLDEDEAMETIFQTHTKNARIVRDTTRMFDQELETDPPTHDYNTIATVVAPSPPLISAGGGVTQGQADALNAEAAAVARMAGLLDAVRLTMDRLNGAVAAGALDAAARQQAALRGFIREAVRALRDRANSLDALLAATEGAGLSDVRYGPAELRQTRDRLRASGFGPDQIAYYHALGYTDDEIVAMRAAEQRLLDEGPFVVTSFYTNLRNARAETHAAASDLERVYDTATSLSGSQAAGSAQVAASSPHTLPGRALPVVFTVGNPLKTAQTITLVVRPASLPLDWTYSLDQPSLSLAPGETATVTLSLHPGAPLVEQTGVRLAIEGYAGEQLIGGIDVQRVVPAYRESTSVEIYLPVLRR